MAARSLPLDVVNSGYSSGRAGLLSAVASLWGAEALEPHGMRDLPGPRMEPVSSALAEGFLTTGPPGKPQLVYFQWVNCKL